MDQPTFSDAARVLTTSSRHAPDPFALFFCTPYSKYRFCSEWQQSQLSSCFGHRSHVILTRRCRFRSIELTHLAIVQQHALGSQAADDAKLVNEAGLVGHPGQMPITSTLSMQNARMELNSRA
eukprot:6210087-Pleurochrysis_carterae.AAC.2